MTPPRKRVAKRAPKHGFGQGGGTRKVPPPPPQGALNPGDTVDYKLSASIKDRGTETWIGYGVVSTVREGETTSDADERIQSHVEDVLNDKIQDFLEGD